MSSDKKGRVILLSLLAVAILVSFNFDKQISVAFASLRGFYLNNFFLGIKLLDTEIALVAFLTFIFLWNRERREWILPLWMTIFITAASTFILKYSIQRQRPFIQGIVPLLPGIANNLGYHTWDFSFPSFDTALVFCAIPLISKFLPRFKYPWIIFSVLVGLSRIYFGVHFLSDVLAGGMLGYIAGILVIEGENKSNRLRNFYRKLFKAKK